MSLGVPYGSGPGFQAGFHFDSLFAGPPCCRGVCHVRTSPEAVAPGGFPRGLRCALLSRPGPAPPGPSGACTCLCGTFGPRGTQSPRRVGGAQVRRMALDPSSNPRTAIPLLGCTLRLVDPSDPAADGRPGSNLPRVGRSTEYRGVARFFFWARGGGEPGGVPTVVPGKNRRSRTLRPSPTDEMGYHRSLVGKRGRSAVKGLPCHVHLLPAIGGRGSLLQPRGGSRAMAAARSHG